MQTRLLSLFLPLFLLLLTACGRDEPRAVVVPGAEPVLLAEGFGFTEGPVAAADGSVFFTDQRNDRILKWTPPATISTVLTPAGRANGLAITPAGRLLACADGPGQLWSIAPEGSVTVLAEGVDGRRFNGPNDCWHHPDGSIFFTDPFYRRPWWEHTEPTQAVEALYRLGPDATTVERVAEGFTRPNGLVGTPDGRWLYVSDLGARRTWRFAVAVDGSLGQRQLFCEQGSDGMTLDASGNVYLTGRDGVSIYTPQGGLLTRIAVPRKWTANVCFGGPDGRTLFITAKDAVFTLAMQVAGATGPAG